MLTIDAKNNITLTKGDTLTLTVELTKDGEPYEVLEGDEIRFAMSEQYVGQPGYVLILTKTIPNDTLTFTIPASETEELKYRTYKYDIQITHPDGAIDTFISAMLKITEEVE